MVPSPKIFDSRKWLRLTDSEPVVVLCLLIRCDRNMKCFPSIETIARDARISEKTVDRTIKNLRAKKLLHYDSIQEHVIKNGKKIIQKKNVYSLFSWAKWCIIPENIEENQKNNKSGHHDPSLNLCNVKSNVNNIPETINDS